MSLRRYVKAGRLAMSSALVALLVGASAGCGGADEAPPAEDKPEGAPAAKAAFTAPGTVVVLQCDPGIHRDMTLTALSVKGGREVATTTVSLAEDSGPSFVCNDPRGGSQPTAPVLRQLFNSDYTRMAGWTRGPGREGEVATAFDLTTGQQVGPGPDPDSFEASPEDSRPVFSEGRLWYVDRDDRLRSRKPEQGADKAEDRGAATADSDMIMASGKPWYGRDPETAAVHPSGRYAAEFDSFWGNLQIRQRGASRDDAMVLSEGTAAGAPEIPSGSASVPSCRPSLWVDDVTLLCSSASQIWRLTLEPGLKKVTAADRLLPTTDRRTYGPVLAPDRKGFAFLSEQGETTAVYRQSFSPGAKPVKIADVSGASAYLIAWQ